MLFWDRADYCLIKHTSFSAVSPNRHIFVYKLKSNKNKHKTIKDLISLNVDEKSEVSLFLEHPLHMLVK